jgi:hypothetical protein
MKLVRVVAPHLVAGFETDGVVRRAAPILKYLVGKTDEEARRYIARKGWRASVISDQIPLQLTLGASAQMSP